MLHLLEKSASYFSLSLSVKLERLQGRLKYSSVQHYESGTAELLLCALCRLAELTLKAVAFILLDTISHSL